MAGPRSPVSATRCQGLRTIAGFTNKSAATALRPAGVAAGPCPIPGHLVRQLDLEEEWEGQFVALQHDLANRASFDRVAPQTLRPEALILPGDRDPADVVLRRTAALLADLSAPGDRRAKPTPARPERVGRPSKGGRQDPSGRRRRGPLRALRRGLPAAPADRLAQSAA